MSFLVFRSVLLGLVVLAILFCGTTNWHVYKPPPPEVRIDTVSSCFDCPFGGIDYLVFGLDEENAFHTTCTIQGRAYSDDSAFACNGFPADCPLARAAELSLLGGISHSDRHG